jgi:hypothetical protein
MKVPTMMLLLGLLMQACATPSDMTTQRTAVAYPRTPPSSLQPDLPEGTDTGKPMSVTPGQVVVTLDRGTYRVGEVVTVTVMNGLDQPVYADDMKSACSIVILQQRQGQDWVSVTGCGMERAPFARGIGPGMGREILLDPNDPIFATATGHGPAFGAGTYRVAFKYRLDPTRDIPDSLVRYSQTFTVAP